MKKTFTLINNKTVIIDSKDYCGLLTHRHIGFDGVRTFVSLKLTTKTKKNCKEWYVVPTEANLKAARELIDAQCKEYNGWTIA